MVPRQPLVELPVLSQKPVPAGKNCSTHRQVVLSPVGLPLSLRVTLLAFTFVVEA